jgi:hypothetical protein
VDEKKAARNLVKHGVSFEEAVSVFWTTASNFSSVNPAFLPTAELMSTQKGHPISAAVRTLPN